MYKVIGAIVGIIAAGLIAGLAIIYTDINEMFGMGIGFVVFVAVYKFFHSLQKNAERSKFSKEDYFENEKTKTWLEEKIVKKLLYGAAGASFDYTGKSEQKGIFSWYPTDEIIEKPPHTIYENIPLAHDFRNKEISWDYVWGEYYYIVKDICELKPDFASYLENINKYYGLFMKIYPDGEITFNDKKVKLSDLEEYHRKIGFRKKDKEKLQSHLGITYEELIEINKLILLEQKKWHDELESVLNVFVEKYKNSF